MNEPQQPSESAWRLHHGKLDAALMRGISAPQLDGTFDRAVWARIAAEQRAALQRPAELSQRLRGDARLAIANWVTGGVVAVGASIVLMSESASSVSLATFSAAATPIVTSLGAVIALLSVAAVSPLGSLMRRYL